MKKYLLILAVPLATCMFVKPALCFLFLGAVFAGMDVFALLFLWNINKRGIYEVGNLIAYQSDDNGSATPIIEFSTESGENIRATPHVYASTDLEGFTNAIEPVERLVPILYDPNNPKRFVLRNEIGLNYLVFTAFILGGAFFIGLGVCWLLGYIDLG